MASKQNVEGKVSPTTVHTLCTVTISKSQLWKNVAIKNTLSSGICKEGFWWGLRVTVPWSPGSLCAPTLSYTSTTYPDPGAALGGGFWLGDVRRVRLGRPSGAGDAQESHSGARSHTNTEESVALPHTGVYHCRHVTATNWSPLGLRYILLLSQRFQIICN